MAVIISAPNNIFQRHSQGYETVSGVISDFAEVVDLQSEYDDVRIHVHKDIITQRSLRIRRELTSDNVFHCSHPYPGSRDVAESLDALKPYITWCYTGSVSDGLALRDLTEDWLVVFAEYKTALWLLDAQYANAILDKWAEQDFDAGTLISHCREMIQHGLQGSKLWQWYVDCLAAKMSTKDFVRVVGRGRPLMV
ncbi:hypothetical protein CBER1_03561 [Cercospora berteroae]|uniref:Uncharacterized protein n=1 Tax=Cercospora berteroae TaxID=357750 RepID=A0A2S6C8B3_9PEZI|nr:hypothetical protein CBER1_03561 [Cercospora berteroae]